MEPIHKTLERMIRRDKDYLWRMVPVHQTHSVTRGFGGRRWHQRIVHPAGTALHLRHPSFHPRALMPYNHRGQRDRLPFPSLSTDGGLCARECFGRDFASVARCIGCLLRNR